MEFVTSLKQFMCSQTETVSVQEKPKEETSRPSLTVSPQTSEYVESEQVSC